MKELISQLTNDSNQLVIIEHWKTKRYRSRSISHIWANKGIIREQKQLEHQKITVFILEWIASCSFQNGSPMVVFKYDLLMKFCFNYFDSTWIPLSNWNSFFIECTAWVDAIIVRWKIFITQTGEWIWEQGVLLNENCLLRSSIESKIMAGAFLLLRFQWRILEEGRAGMWILRQVILGHFRPSWGIFGANALFKDTFYFEDRGCIPTS